VFVDINMPKMNGHEFMSEACKFFDKIELKPIYFLVLSSSEESIDIEKHDLSCYVGEHLVKGRFNEKDLKNIIYNLGGDFLSSDMNSSV